ncbi:DM13 domain-containing protein [Flavobacterium sp.]|uniref:DM13 domain-containing protein n=1 Tax=Flavobacterium sp. TaxID=239 RepID=UPI0037532B04
MKNTTLLLIMLFVFSMNSNAQCTTQVTNFGNNTTTPMYNITGNANVVLNADNTITLNLMSNFMTAAGPDVRAYIIDPGNITDAMIKSSNISAFPNRIMMGIVSSNTIPEDGAKTFTVPIPSGQNIANYTIVLFYCQQFNAFWDFGKIIAFSPVNCSLLGTNTFETNVFRLYPNPVVDELNFDFKDFKNNFSVKIYNSLGSVVINNSLLSFNNNKLNTNSLNSGVYFIELNDDNNNRFVQRFVKQ